MSLVINLLIAVIAGVITDIVAQRLGADSRLAVLLAVLVGVVVFLANPVAAF